MSSKQVWRLHWWGISLWIADSFNFPTHLFYYEETMEGRLFSKEMLKTVSDIKLLESS